MQNKIEPFQIATRPRHIRYIYLINENCNYDELVKLMMANMRYWGGRYNPIIPIKEGKIQNRYLEFASMFDPDIVFYTSDVNLPAIKELRIFRPQQYKLLDFNEIEGINAYYLMPSVIKNRMVLTAGDIYNVNGGTSDFYHLNLGLPKSAIYSDYQIVNDHKKLIIGSQNYHEINLLLNQHKPCLPADLAKLNAQTPILRSKDIAGYNANEIVIAKDKKSTEDLLYFWNRQLYECGSLIFITLSDLLTLSPQKEFGTLLNNLTSDHHISVVSFSVSEKDLQPNIDACLRQFVQGRSFQFKKVIAFPYKVTDRGGYKARSQEKVVLQTLYSRKGIFNLPPLSFTTDVEFESQQWAIDLQVRNNSNPNSIWHYFPITLNPMEIISAHGRITKERQLCCFVGNRNRSVIPQVVSIKIPKLSDILSKLFMQPVIESEIKKTKYERLALHDSSNRLNGFINMFRSNFEDIDHFFTDKFWVDIFELLSTCDKPAGDSITFKELTHRCKTVFEFLGMPLKSREESVHNFENMQKGLLSQLQHLCDLGVFIPGFRLKCTECSSINWYDLDSTTKHVKCQGCLKTFNFPLETYASYKLSGLIRNNIFQPDRQRDGNLTIIRTLVSLALRSGYRSFEYFPQLNLFDNYAAGKPINEIDFVCLGDGKLIVGEGKHDSKEFMESKKKSLISLIDIAKEIQPERIVLSCYKDSQDKLGKAKDYLDTMMRNWKHPPEVTTLLLHQPDYSAFKSDQYLYYAEDTQKKNENIPD